MGTQDDDNARGRPPDSSPAMTRLRGRAPVWVGTAYWEPQEVPLERVRDDFRRMRALGLTLVRLHCIDWLPTADGGVDTSRADAWIDAAAEAGLAVVAHLPTVVVDRDELARRDLDDDDVRRLGYGHPDVRAALRAGMARVMDRYRDRDAVIGWSVGGGEMNAEKVALVDEIDRRAFRSWLEQRYGTPAGLHRAWTIYPEPYLTGRYDCFRIGDFDQAVELAAGVVFDGTGGRPLAATSLSHKVYGPARDLVRFRADAVIERARVAVAVAREIDPDRHYRIGSHQLMYNHPRLGWDVQRMAASADGHPTSIHLSWHFEAVDGEVDLPVYLQARMTADVVKGGFGAAFETTGGPVQYSGGYGNHMDVGLMRRLMCAYLAGGNPVIAFWCWRPRPGGWEAGEYGFLTLSDRESPWAVEAGRITRAMERHAHDLWNGDDEPEVGILRSWDTEMILTLEPPRHDLEDGPTTWSRGTPLQHLRAVIGAGRAAVDHHLAFHYLGEQEVLDGLVGRYPCLYAPHLRACSVELLAALAAWVRAGGHLVVDVQFGFLDPWGKLHPRGEGSTIERLCGCWIDSIHDARTCRQRLGEVVLTDGFHGDLVCTGAEVADRFADGRPAVARHRLGAGTVTTIACDPARVCHRPGNDAMETFLAGLLRGERPPRFTADAPLVFRRRGPARDHFWVLNDSGEERTVHVAVQDRRYTSCEDVLDGDRVGFADDAITLRVAAGSAAWVACERSETAATGREST